jgi:hypothetical protein
VFGFGAEETTNEIPYGTLPISTDTGFCALAIAQETRTKRDSQRAYVFEGQISVLLLSSWLQRLKP